MRWRGVVKKQLYGARPLYRGWFRYFGEKVSFPRGSHLFSRVCDEGIYEHDTLRFVQSAARAQTTYMDVGANIGLLAVPILKQVPGVDVISVEASPATAAYLRKTQQDSSFRNRWSVVECAVGAHQGEAVFFASSPENGAFDGLKDTGRGGHKKAIGVGMRTLDSIWMDAGAPRVSVIKIDVEGAEKDVLAGAQQLLAKEKPAVVMEWNCANLAAYGIDPTVIFDICTNIGYDIFLSPGYFRIDRGELLSIGMALSETIVLLPKTQS